MVLTMILDMFKNRARKKKERAEKAEASVSWTFLGGNNENRIGANCGLLTYCDPNAVSDQAKSMRLLFDLGSMPGDSNSPEDRVLADCDTVIPDVTDCFFHKHDKDHNPQTPVSGIFLTHSHMDHLGAISFMILMGYEMPPIYATPFTAKRLYQSFENQRIPKELWPEVTEIAPGQSVVKGDVKVTSFSVSHSTPQSVGFYIETPEGNIVQPGDFKLDQTLCWGPGFSEERFKEMVKGGVDLLLLDSTGADKDVDPITEQDVRDTLTDVFNKKAKKRFIIASMGGFEETLASVATVTAQQGRQLWVAGWSHEQAIKALEETGLSLGDHIGHAIEVRKVTPGRPSRDLAEQKPSDTVVLVTGAQGKSNAVLTHAANGRSRMLELDQKKDVILFCAPSIPGPDRARQEKIVGLLKKQGYEVYTNQDMLLYAHGHGRLPEILKLAEMSGAKAVTPVHGSAKLRADNKQALEEAGFKVLSAENGQVVTLKKGRGFLDRLKQSVARLIGFKTRTGRHWQDRDYFAIFSPQPEDLSEQEQQKAQRKEMPSVFHIHPRRPDFK